MQHIRLVVPITSEDLRNPEDFEGYQEFGLRVSVTTLDSGPPSIESEYDEVLAAPATVKRCVEAARDGADAIVIDCMGDPALNAVREVLGIPVLGPMQTSMHAAAMLGHKFSVVTVVKNVVPIAQNLAQRYGLRDRLASVRYANVPVLEIDHDLERTHRQLAQESLKAVREDGADFIILGCTGFMGCDTAIKAAFLDEGVEVPVIDPIPLTISVAGALARLRLSQSKAVYQSPRIKPIIGFDDVGNAVTEYLAG